MASSIPKELQRASILHSLITDNISEIFRKTPENPLKYTEIYAEVEQRIRNILKKDGDLQAGLAFPVGISVNHVAAHDSCLGSPDERFVLPSDIIKLDVGIHNSGYIIDCARTFVKSPRFEQWNPLIEATKEATTSVIRDIRPDSRIIEISGQIQEIIGSFEISGASIQGMVGIGGHNLKPYIVHAGQLIPCRTKGTPGSGKIQVGQYAIETFASTGSGDTIDIPGIPCSHFMIPRESRNDPNLSRNENLFLRKIWETRKSLPFSQIEAERIPEFNKMLLRKLIMKDKISSFAALGDKVGTMTSQYENTIWVGEEKTYNMSEDSFGGI